MPKFEKKPKSTKSYDAKDITVLEGLDPVRKRPGMYIGTTGPDGLHHLITEIFDNSRDEAMAGEADRIEIALLPGNHVRVVDNGRGIPVDKHPKTNVSALETIMTTLHSGGKFGGGGYRVSGGLHGVGASVVNALSEEMTVEVHKKGFKYIQQYKRGKRVAPVKKVGATDHNGSVTTFKPDYEIFSEIVFERSRIIAHMRQQAYLIKGLKITVIDAREHEGNIDLGEIYLEDLKIDVPTMSFYFEGGLISLIKFYNRHQKPIQNAIFYVEKEIDNVGVEIALQYVDDFSSKIFPFANTIYNSEGGTHITGFKTALTRTLNAYARTNNLLKEADENFTGDDVLEGLTAVISIKMPEIQFEGQTKAKLGSTEARGATETVFSEGLSAFLEENPEDAKAIIAKVLLALRARKAAKAAKDSILRKGVLEGMTLPGKLADCQSRKADESELFIVEGDSAGGTAKAGRDRRIQAILPLRGKILNVERARLDRMLGSDSIKSLILALGTAIGETFDIEKLRYHKIIIATDADVDGAHIRTLILTLFYRYFKPVIEGGYLYIAQPPLYKVSKGKESHYFYTEGSKDDFIKSQDPSSEEEKNEEDGLDSEDEDPKKKKKSLSIQRYKGLGEMNADQLWETTMDPKVRVLKQVKIDDAESADQIFDILMGTDVSARKSFIQSNAKSATLDL
jgi:DNA gyrase subunit B